MEEVVITRVVCTKRKVLRLENNSLIFSNKNWEMQDIFIGVRIQIPFAMYSSPP